MKILFRETFGKDLLKVKDGKIKKTVKEIIIKIENSDKLTDVSGVKFLKGSKNAYRIRIGNYRLGFFYNDNTIDFSRFLHRKEIYKKFP